MKLISIATAAAFLVATVSAKYSNPEGSVQINSKRQIDSLNSEDSSWVAGHNENFGDRTFDEVRRWAAGTALGNHISDYEHLTRPQKYYDSLNATVPTEFDARTAFPGLIRPIRNQERCGSCWAFSSSEVLSDRFAIATKNPSFSPLSPEDMVSCDSSDLGCSGGMLPHAWKYLTKTGIVTDKCFPYGAGNGTAPACATKCVNGDKFQKFKAKKAYAIKGVANMQKEIMTHGPIQVAFMVYKSFMSYKSGVYHKKFLEFIPEGGHAVKIVGWGTERGIDYWLVANSWGPKWGDKGFFKIKRGKNECSIEKEGPPFAGLPSV